MLGFAVLLAAPRALRARSATPVVPLSAKRDAAPLAALDRRPEQRSDRAIGDGQIHDPQCAASRRGRQDRRDLRSAAQRGRHTTTHSTLHLLPDDPAAGWIVDSPGMKVFGLAHVAPDVLAHAFVEFRPFLGRCRFRDCRHDREPGCAMTPRWPQGTSQPFRVALWKRLVRRAARRAAAGGLPTAPRWRASAAASAAATAPARARRGRPRWEGCRRRARRPAPISGRKSGSPPPNRNGPSQHHARAPRRPLASTTPTCSPPSSFAPRRGLRAPAIRGSSKSPTTANESAVRRTGTQSSSHSSRRAGPPKSRAPARSVSLRMPPRVAAPFLASSAAAR